MSDHESLIFCLFAAFRRIMNTGSLQELLYTFLDWHPARIQTFIGLIFAVIKAKTVKVKEMAIYIESKGSLHHGCLMVRHASASKLAVGRTASEALT